MSMKYLIIGNKIYPFPAKAGQIGLALFSEMWPHDVHLVRNKVPKIKI